MYALSNGNADVKIGIGHLFSHHLSAAGVGFAKPHPAMFQQALEKANVARIKPYILAITLCKIFRRLKMWA
jgi:HAD superfamily hydrolase (TIGR01509 family)